MKKIDPEDSLYCLWDSLTLYQKSLIGLWKSIYTTEIQDKIIVKSIIDSLEYIHCFLNIMINRYELAECARIPLSSQNLITKIENNLQDVYQFSHECRVSLYQARKLASLYSIILSDLELLKYLCQNKEFTNNPKLKWTASHVFSPNSC